METHTRIDAGRARMAYHEFYADDFTPREHYRPLWEHIRATGRAPWRRRPMSPNWRCRLKGSPLRSTANQMKDRADLALRPHPPDHHRPGVGNHRGGTQTAGPGPQPVPL